MRVIDDVVAVGVGRSELTRRRFMALCGSVMAAGLFGNTLGQRGLAGDVLRIGAVIPTLTGADPLGAFTADVVGNVAHMGATLAAETLAGTVEERGRRLKVLVTSAPDAESAARAAERLSSVEEVYGIVGGFDTASALALSALAARREFVFMNIGAQDDVLRGASCNPHAFHIEASTAMYLDALVTTYARSGRHRWFVVHDDGSAGKARYDQTLAALASRDAHAEVFEAAVTSTQPMFIGTIDAIRDAKPDVVLLLLEAWPRLIFMGQYETSGTDIEVIGYPTPSAQLREYYATSSYGAPRTGSGRHLALWEATLVEHGAGDLNARFLARFGRPMDPPAWSAYMAIKILAEAAMATSSTDSAAIISHLENPQTIVDVGKGEGTSFRPWDHQLRQPLYLVDTRADYQDTTSYQDIATVESVIPPAGDDPRWTAAKRLDGPGVREIDSACILE